MEKLETAFYDGRLNLEKQKSFECRLDPRYNRIILRGIVYGRIKSRRK